MSKKIIFILTSFILLVVLILNTTSSNIQDSKSDLLLNEIKKTQDYNTNIVTINKFFANANLFHETENLTNYNNCNNLEFQNYSTCVSLKSINTIETSQNITDEMKYFYFDDSVIKEIGTKDTWISWLNFFQNLLLGITFLGQIFIILFVKRKDL